MNKRILFLVLSMILCIVLIITGIIAGQKNSQNEAGSETPKPSVTLTPPKPDTLPPSADTSSPETVPPPPYAGTTFTVLAPNSGDLLLGDSMGGDTVSEAVYGRNVALCQETGVTMLFKYSLDVYGDIEAGAQSGSAAPDLVMLNMQSDGSRFLMNGGLLDVSELYGSAKGLDNAFSDSMSVAKKQYFILGELTPSRVLARYYLKIRTGSSVAVSLISASRDGALTYEALFEILAEDGATLSLNSDGLHAMISDGLFSMSAGGEATVDISGYVKGAQALSVYKAQVNVSHDAEPEVTVGTFLVDGCVYLPLPTDDGAAEGAVVDMSRLFPFALTENCPDREMSLYVLSRMLGLSEGLTELVINEYKLPSHYGSAYCLYDVFGWGDFSSHAYTAFTNNKTDSLSKTLEAPKRASLQALSILFERNS